MRVKLCIIIKGKLKDLIAMPEEFDRDESIEHSHLSDHDLFNMTATILRNNFKKPDNHSSLVETNEEHKQEDLSDLMKNNLNASSTIIPASSVLKGVFTAADLYAIPEALKKGENVK
jgi:hypothetical protein